MDSTKIPRRLTRRRVLTLLSNERYLVVGIEIELDGLDASRRRQNRRRLSRPLCNQISGNVILFPRCRRRSWADGRRPCRRSSRLFRKWESSIVPSVQHHQDRAPPPGSTDALKGRKSGQRLFVLADPSAEVGRDRDFLFHDRSRHYSIIGGSGACAHQGTPSA